MKQVSITERFQWAQKLFPILKQFENDGVSFYEVVASHADIKNRNGRVYTGEEIQRAASSLSERPLNINHDKKRMLPFPENQVLVAREEDALVECIIQVADPRVNKMIESGEIKHVSIEGIYLDESKNTHTTEYPTSLHFTALALLTQDDEPGDAMAQIIKDSLNVNVLLPGQITEKLGFGQDTNSCGLAEHESEPEDEKIEIKKVKKVNPNSILEADWSGSFISDLPDDSFAYVEPGGHKDEQGKTVPRTLRHLPYKSADGQIDKPHLRNALARLSQTKLPAQAKGAARKRLVAAAKQVGIETSMDDSLAKFKEAYENWKIAREIQFAILDDMDLDSDADRDKIASPELKHPTVPESPQNFDARSAVQMDPAYQGTGKSKIEMPKMDYPPETNPLAITNDKVPVTQGSAPDLYTALKNAPTNPGFHVQSGVKESTPKVTKPKLKIITK